jgi:predicted CoA-binding protein
MVKSKLFTNLPWTIRNYLITQTSSKNNYKEGSPVDPQIHETIQGKITAHNLFSLSELLQLVYVQAKVMHLLKSADAAKHDPYVVIWQLS